MFGEQRQVLQVLSACVGRVQLGQLSEHDAPRLHLLGGVLDPRDGLPTAEGRFRVKTCGIGMQIDLIDRLTVN